MMFEFLGSLSFFLALGSTARTVLAHIVAAASLECSNDMSITSPLFDVPAVPFVSVAELKQLHDHIFFAVLAWRS